MADVSLDIENAPALIDYLRATRRIGPNESPRATKLSGGVSNRTVLLERADGEAWVLKQALERLRVRVDWRSDPRRIEREALGMRRLAELAPAGAITPLIFLEPSMHLLAMRAVPQPHDNWKALLMAGRLDAGHVRQFAELLATLHRGAHERRDLLAREFDDRTYFQTLRLEPYYLYAAERMPAIEPFMRSLVEATLATRQTIVHGDYSPKNVLIHDGRLVLIDHEVIHFGDGAFDLGFALSHLLSKANALHARRGDFAGAAASFWATYWQALGGHAAAWAGDLEARACRHTLACLLARCIGRSPLEYLSPPAAAAQANAASALMDRPPERVAELVDEFVRRLGE